jgi:hypothetical protein
VTSAGLGPVVAYHPSLAVIEQGGHSREACPPELSMAGRVRVLACLAKTGLALLPRPAGAVERSDCGLVRE